VLSTPSTNKPASKFFIFSWAFIAAVLAITLGLWLLWFSQEQIKRNSTVGEVERHVDAARQTLVDELANLRFELRVLIENPLLYRYVQQPSRQTMQQLQQYYQWFIKDRTITDQLRLLSDTGLELLRVNQQPDRPVIVAKKDLTEQIGTRLCDCSTFFKER